MCVFSHRSQCSKTLALFELVHQVPHLHIIYKFMTGWNAIDSVEKIRVRLISARITENEPFTWGITHEYQDDGWKALAIRDSTFRTISQLHCHPKIHSKRHFRRDGWSFSAESHKFRIHHSMMWWSAQTWEHSWWFEFFFLYSEPRWEEIPCGRHAQKWHWARCEVFAFRSMHCTSTWYNIFLRNICMPERWRCHSGKYSWVKYGRQYFVNHFLFWKFRLSVLIINSNPNMVSNWSTTKLS